LSNVELSLLDKGLLFIPTIKTFPSQEILDARDKIVRNLKLKAYFNDEGEEGEYIKKTFQAPSSWQPRNSQLDKNVLDTISKINLSTHNLLCSLPGNNNGSLILSGKSNLTNDERAALRGLKDNSNIVIKSADKGGAIVVMDREAYVTEAYRQLSNPKYYKKLPAPIFPDNIAKLNSVLQRISNKGLINEKQLAFLSADIENTRPRLFYLLPKIHKKAESWPQPGRMPEGRPIVSDCSSESYNISEYIDSFISPLACQHPAYIKDTYDFVNKVRDKPVQDNVFIVTGDVTSLYTNMNLDRIISVIRETFNKNPNGLRPSDEILELLDLTLKNNDFEFNNEYFLQIHGTAMGKRYAPSLANLYLVFFDFMATNGFRIKPDFFFRFLDDIFFIWKGSKEDLTEFENFLNNLIPDIKVTLNCQKDQIDFLDTTVYKLHGPSGTTLQTRVFFKPTDTHQLLHTKSFHPKHTFTGVLKSQVLRFKRISSTFEDFSLACKTLFAAIEIRGYSRSKLRKMKRDIWSNNLPQKDPKDSKMIPLVLRYNQIAHKFMTLWKESIKENSVFEDYRLVAAFSKNKNLGNFLTRSKLSDPTNQVPHLLSVTARENSGFQPCGSQRCYACQFHCYAASTFSSVTCNNRHKIFDPLSCDSDNIVYLITCNKCHMQYVGESGRSLRERLTDHRSNIKNHKMTPIGIHFNSTGHNFTDLKAIAIEKIKTNNLMIRRQREQFWQQKLNTKHPFGLNELPVE
jgi:hypothetical protein